MSKNKNKGSVFHLDRLVKTGLVAAIAAGVSTMASAGEPIHFENGGVLQWNVTTSYALGMRMSKQDSKLIADPLADDGNRNFDRYSLTSNKVSALAELTYTNKNTWGEWGGVVRGSTFYDDVYHRSNDNDSPFTVNKSGAHDEFTAGAKRYSGGRTRFLDAYVFTDIQLPSEQYLAVKAGRHMVAWGEGLYYPGVNGAQGKVDVVKAVSPGTETKEILLPTGQVSMDWNISQFFGLSAYYQYEWLPNELPPVGSFTSTTDVVGPRPESLMPGGGVPYRGVNSPSDSGQYGVRAMYRPNFDWEFSLFHINYHDKNPYGLTVAPGFSGYKIDYMDNIKLTGISGSTSFGDTQVSTEISYRDGMPVAVKVADGAGGFDDETVRGKGYQAQVSFLHALGNYPWARGTILIGELINTGVTSVEGNGKYSYDMGGDYQTKSSTAYTLTAVFEYPGVVSGWDFSVPVSFSHIIDGATPIKGAISGGEGNKELSLGLSMQYAGNLELDLGYVAKLSSANLKKGRDSTDRDELTFSAKYSF